TQLTAVAPAGDGRLCPRWLRFIGEMFGDDAELIRFVQQWFGYCLTGDTCEHALWFGFGSGGNGKSVLLNTVSGILGSYAKVAPMDTFTATRFTAHPAELAML